MKRKKCEAKSVLKRGMLFLKIESWDTEIIPNPAEEDSGMQRRKASCDQRGMMRPGQPPNPPSTCRFARTEKPFPKLSDNGQKIRHQTEIYYIIERNLVSKREYHVSACIFRIDIITFEKTIPVPLSRTSEKGDGSISQLAGLTG